MQYIKEKIKIILEYIKDKKWKSLYVIYCIMWHSKKFV
jgi:hypothetical protein